MDWVSSKSRLGTLKEFSTISTIRFLPLPEYSHLKSKCVAVRRNKGWLIMGIRGYFSLSKCTIK